MEKGLVSSSASSTINTLLRARPSACVGGRFGKAGPDLLN